MSEDNAEYRYVRPLPCILDEHGETRKQTVKQLFAKVDEELNELKEIVYRFQSADMLCVELSKNHDTWRDIAEEAADTITAITTLCAAFGIDAEMRNKAQEIANAKIEQESELMKELDDLRAQVVRMAKEMAKESNADPGKAAFSAYFNLSKNAFNGMLEAVGKIENDQEKYRTAMVKMLEVMIETVKG